MDIHKIIQDRWSPVAFSDRVPDEEKMNTLFTAASRAPSSYNAQPWGFIYGIRGEDPVYDVLYKLLYEMNRKWAGTAPILCLGIAETIHQSRKTPNQYAFYDTGMAVGNLLAQATDMQLFVHQMGGFDHELAVQELNLPKGVEPAAMMAIGYKGDPGQLPDDIASRESQRKPRKPVEEFVRRAKFKPEK